MKPFFNFGCALVAWGELCRVARTRNYPGRLDPLPPQAFCQGRHNHQFVYASSAQLLKPYQAILLEPLWLLDQRQDGRWQLVATALGNSLNLRLQALLRAWMSAIPQAEEAGPQVARLRLALRSFQGEIGSLPPSLSVARQTDGQSPLVRGISPYLEQISSIVQLEDARDGRLLGGGVNLQGPQAEQGRSGQGWQDLLACNWQQILQFGHPPLAAG
ncbi:hypothetical protein BI347_05060 [Chromobacterium sphagni]|uniref:Uncharacterized protein n=1 Tax=Chromobacterium sphagni TaxID=1903179 RepID=A0A1S1X0T8_9NEIS|nr:DUF3313 family protein [Chromobacterium sphagni]OHX12948.1 hypothetical protein BI347_05060 [Chromobacterium sphagni]